MDGIIAAFFLGFAIGMAIQRTHNRLMELKAENEKMKRGLMDSVLVSFRAKEKNVASES